MSQKYFYFLLSLCLNSFLQFTFFRQKKGSNFHFTQQREIHHSAPKGHVHRGEFHFFCLQGLPTVGNPFCYDTREFPFSTLFFPPSLLFYCMCNYVRLDSLSSITFYYLLTSSAGASLGSTSLHENDKKSAVLSPFNSRGKVQ
jgi:hypothetical protein